MGVGDMYVGAVRKGRYGIIAFWLVMLVLGVVFGPKYLSYTSGTFKAPPGTRAYTATKAYEGLFPSDQDKGTLIVLVSPFRRGQKVDESPWVGNFTLALAQDIEIFSAHNSGEGKFVDSVAGYYLLKEGKYTGLAEAYVSPSKGATIISITYSKGASKKTTDAFINYLDAKTKSLAGQLTAMLPEYGCAVGVTGQDALWKAGGEETKASLAKTDMFVLPIAVLVLAAYLGSLRLMVIPLFALGASMLTGFMIMYPIARYKWNVAQVAPSIQSSLSIALSIDYSLFLLTRFKEEVLIQKRTPHEAVSIMCRTASLVVLVSGSTLTVSFLGLAAFPLEFLQSIGIGAAVTLFCTISVNLTLTPAILSTFPNFFAKFGLPEFILNWYASVRGKPMASDGKGKPMTPSEARPLLMSDPDGIRSIQGQLSSPVASSSSLIVEDVYMSASGAKSPLHSDPQTFDGGNASGSGAQGGGGGHGISIADPVEFQTMVSKMFWYRSSKYSAATVSAVVIIVVVLAILLPFSVQIKDLRVTADATLVFPRNAYALKEYNAFQAEFPPGLIGPYYVLAAPHSASDSVLTPEYFEFTETLTNVLTQSVPASGITSLTWVAGRKVTFDNATRYLSYAGPGGPDASEFSQAAYAYQLTFHSLTNEAGSAARVKVLTPFDPLGEPAKPWLVSLRSLLADAPSLRSYAGSQFSALYVLGGNVIVIDTMDRIYHLFPYVVAAIAAVILIIVSIMYRSVFAPIRLLATIVVPISAVFGLAILVFQKGKFDKLNENVLSTSHGLYWINPVMAVSILIGLALDYDIFISSRVIELRKMGFDNYSSIRLAVGSTGSVISIAGLIMAIAFSSLLFLSTTMILNQLGFLLCVTILLDTFLIRPVIVPCTIWLAGDIVWWPTKMPEPFIHLPWQRPSASAHS